MRRKFKKGDYIRDKIYNMTYKVIKYTKSSNGEKTMYVLKQTEYPHSWNYNQELKFSMNDVDKEFEIDIENTLINIFNLNEHEN